MANIEFNKDMFKRSSTWVNIGEAAMYAAIQALGDLSSEMTVALWVQFGLRVVMGAVQGVKVSAKS